MDGVRTILGRWAGGVVLCGLAWCAGLPAAAELVLVEDGVSRAPIVVARGVSPLTRQAADHLAEYIEKTSGARPEVVEGAPDPLPARAIWVGYQPALQALVPGVDFEFKHPEEILLAATSNHLVIAGRDRWHAEPRVANTNRVSLAGLQQEFGTANAVYTFLQDRLGVRWLWPGELGEDILRKRTIAFEPFEFRYHPQIRSRGGILNYSRLDRSRGYGRSHAWSRFQRLQLDSLQVSGGHGFGDWWDKYHETHPDFFALQPDGTRSGFPGPRTAKMCKSNPALWDQWMIEVERQRQEDPAQTVFDASANDSWASGYCVCERCRAWDHPDGEPRMFHWRGVNQEYVALADRQVTLANTLARKLKARYPEEDYYVKIMAYGHSRPAPIKAVPDSNVLVSCVANFLMQPAAVDTASPRGTRHREQFEAWGKVAPNLFWRPNKARKMTSMPHISARQAIKDFRFVADHRCIGIYVDMVWEHWATRGPLYYVMARMAWDPWQDGEAMLDDYYRRGFGKAAGDIRAYWDLMETKWAQSQTKEFDYPELFDQAFFEQAYARLARADRAVEGEPDVYRKRIEFVRKGLDYARLVTEARSLMVRFEASGEKDTAAADGARALWVDKIMPLATAPENRYAINWGPARPGQGHKTAGCYPKDLEQRKW